MVEGAAVESLIDARQPPLKTQFAEYWSYRGLLGHVVIKELKVRYRHTSLGLLWALAQPLLPALVLGAVFSTAGISRGSDVPYLLFLLAGLVPWSFFSIALSSGSGAFVANGYLLSKVYFPRAILPAAMVSVALLECFCGCAILCAWVAVSGWPVRASWLWLPLLCVADALVAFLLAVGIASLNVVYRDTRHALPFLLQVWMYATPVLYSPMLVSARWRWLFGLNPVTGIVLGFRHALFGTPLDARLALLSATSGVVAMLVGVMIFRWLEPRVAELL